MRFSCRYRLLVTPVFLCSIFLFGLAVHCRAEGFEVFDLVTGVIDSPHFKGKDPLTKLRLAADLLRNKKLRHSDMTFLVLDWGDRYLREPSDPMERLRRWAELNSDDQLSHLRIPRDVLNRILLAEYLVGQPQYMNGGPLQRLEILKQLSESNLVDWSVSLAYARLYAGGLISGGKTYQPVTPLEGLTALKQLKDNGLVGWHYKVPTEAILVAEALAMDKGFQQASPYDQLLKLRDLERKGLITMLTKKELEKLPAWRMLISETQFLKSDPAVKKTRLSELKSEGLLSASTWSDLATIFRPVPLATNNEHRPMPLPEKTQIPAN
ncbi:hypothetical protein Desti_4628 [Desulfomonile tiedjei DSM 6799]|uniref:Uncharacterized protein n=1 Tax=Desulfomonile tiedjei (strain ATCC 49306 / DSM 6799 / DCB-1) TaxID=706587 RepID=I4CCG1_DESTA|nr:hypothetical protein Desti_4628 [Desulfomonile tiedjei DSM 6799]